VRDHPSVRARVELVSGVVTGLLGALGMTAVLSLAENPGEAFTLILAIVPGLLALGVAVGACLHASDGHRTGRWLV
jgi:hypothetical protein